MWPSHFGFAGGRPCFGSASRSHGSPTQNCWPGSKNVCVGMRFSWEGELGMQRVKATPVPTRIPAECVRVCKARGHQDWSTLPATV